MLQWHTERPVEALDLPFGIELRLTLDDPKQSHAQG
jgi:hypothetical protein